MWFRAALVFLGSFLYFRNKTQKQQQAQMQKEMHQAAAFSPRRRIAQQRKSWDWQ